jgi:hypothetical protein
MGTLMYGWFLSFLGGGFFRAVEDEGSASSVFLNGH